MTNIEAINVLNMVEAYGLADEAKKLAIDALKMVEEYKADHEKQIPKKPNRIEYVDGGAEDDCPNCGKRICMVFGNGDTFRWQMPYCCDCGQAIDWGEGESE